MIDNRKKYRVIGDFQVGKKIIEVKGHNEDYPGEKTDPFDFIARSITLSAQEWKFLKKTPNLFEIYVVYRLNEIQYKDNPEWNFPKFICIKGSEIVDKKIDRPIVRVKIPKSFWSDKGERQVPVPKTIFNKVKKKYTK
ncbi:MAG: hypothetical protein OPY08_01450 [Nitrosopumilus sp.]|nr:hypothetical protein [Nitrosopumilus sp.]